MSVHTMSTAIMYLNSLSISLNAYSTTRHVNISRNAHIAWYVNSIVNIYISRNIYCILDTNILRYRYYPQVLKNQQPNANSNNNQNAF